MGTGFVHDGTGTTPHQRRLAFVKKPTPKATVDRLNFWRSTSRNIDGLTVGTTESRPHPALRRVEEALRLIKRHDALHYSRVMHNLERIWVHLLPNALACSLPRDLLELKVERAWSPATDRDDHDQHRGCDQAEHALCARGLQEEADDEARKYRAEPTERIREADGAGAHSGGKQLGLVIVERVGKHVVR